MHHEINISLIFKKELLMECLLNSYFQLNVEHIQIFQLLVASNLSSALQF